MEHEFDSGGMLHGGGSISLKPQATVLTFKLPTPGGTAKDDALNRLSVLMSVFDDMCPREREAALAYLTGYASTDNVSNS